jgi:uncharacterized protein
MALDIILILLGAACVIGGIVGCILPLIPGPPLSFLGFIILQCTSKFEYSWQFFLAWGLVVGIVQFLDYIVPIWGTKRFGGGRKGAWGSAIGVVVGIFVYPPWGLIICPFAGAIIGELIDGRNTQEAFRAGFGSFVGFLAGNIIKLIVALALAFIYFKDVIKLIWNWI